MANWLGKVRLPVLRSENGAMRPVIGASVNIYDTLSNGLSPVTPTGGVDVSASLSTIYSDKEATIALAQPLITDTQGIVEFYAASGDLHIVVTPLTGSKIGILFYPHFGPHAGAVINKKTTGLSRFGDSGSGIDIDESIGSITIFADGSSYLVIDATTGLINMIKRTVLFTGIADPAGQADGECYYKTDTNQLRVFNGGVWRGVTLA